MRNLIRVIAFIAIAFLSLSIGDVVATELPKAKLFYQATLAGLYAAYLLYIIERGIHDRNIR